MMMKNLLCASLLVASAISGAQTTIYSTNFDAFSNGNLNGQSGWGVDAKSQSFFDVVNTLSRSGTKSVKFSNNNGAAVGSSYGYKTVSIPFTQDTYVGTVYVYLPTQSRTQVWCGLTTLGTNSVDSFYNGNVQAGVTKEGGAQADGFLGSPYQFPVPDAAPLDDWARVQVVIRPFDGVTNNTGYFHGNVDGKIVGPAAPGASCDYKAIDEFDIWVYNRFGNAFSCYFDDFTVEKYDQNESWIAGRMKLAFWPNGKATTGKVVLRSQFGDEVIPVSIDADGYFKAQFTSTGSCEVFYKVDNGLSRKVGTFDFNGVLAYWYTGGSIDLLGGDCDGNDYVNTDDYLILSGSFDLSAGDPNYDSRADLDGNDYINTDDYLALSQNFDLGGEAL